MIRGTTPVLTLHVSGETFDNSKIFVALEQNDCKPIIKSGDEVKIVPDDDGEGTTLTVSYTQEETLSLDPGPALVQVRWITADGVADATVIKKVIVGDVLQDEVISYGD
jgi:hypothetical protein